MTEEAKRVVAGLRYCYRHIHCYSIKDGERCPDYDACQKKVADNVSRNDALADLIESLSAQLEQVTRERDAMRRQLHKGGRACESCRYAEDTPDNNAVCAECRPEGEDSLWSHWEWRGAEVTNDAQKGSDAKS